MKGRKGRHDGWAHTGMWRIIPRRNKLAQASVLLTKELESWCICIYLLVVSEYGFA